MKRTDDIRNMKFTSSSGKNVRDTQMLKGDAKDSLSGTNVTTEHRTSASIAGPYGGMNKAK